MAGKFALLIDTALDNDQVEVLLTDHAEIIGSQRVNFSSSEAQPLLPAIHALLAAADRSWTDLAVIGVVTGAPRFTVARLAVVVANALAWSIGRPVAAFSERPTPAELAATPAGQPFAAALEPVYASDPTITLAHAKTHPPT